ncbi:MAG TPA: hypothetical protein VHJ78_03330 [Actinomycetota bacterium]|nr:hypothetical protein [Actinomycetota bacterium]
MLRKIGFFTGFWWISLRERDEWLEEWINKKSARVQLFLYRTATFIGVAGALAFLLGLAGNAPSLPRLFALAAGFGAVTLWLRSKSWITEYQDIFAGRYD